MDRVPVRGLDEIRPHTYSFSGDGEIPNNPTHPVIIYPGVLEVSAMSAPASMMERLFTQNKWGDVWRDGIYEFVHYHSSAHEALGVACGEARVRLGGRHGQEIDFHPGDVVILPAGTGHQCLSATNDFLVVGAYPPNAQYDLCRGTKEERDAAIRSIPLVPTPPTDPVFGIDGLVIKLWRDRAIF